MSIAAISERVGTIQALIQELTSPRSTTTGAATTSATTATDFASALSTLGSPAGGGTGTGVTGEDIVTQAKRYLGVPYVFGGEDETGMDCSGLVQRVLADLGIDAPRVVVDQADIGVEVPSLDQARPGDLIVTKDEGHIVIYAGDGKIIHAPRPGKDVQLVDNYLSPAEIGTIRRVASAEPQTPSLAGVAATPSADVLSIMQVLFAGADRSGSGSLDTLAATLAPLAAALEARAAAARTAAPGAAPVSSAASAPASATAASAAVFAAAPVAASSDPPPTRRDDVAPAAPIATTAAGDTRAASAPAPAAAARPALAPQLSPQIVSLSQAGDGDHRVTLTVSPDELGPVTVRAHISGDTMRIELLAPSEAGRDAIRHILGDLRRDLAAAAPHASLTLATGDGSAAAQSGADGSATRHGAAGRAQGDAPDRGAASRDAVPLPVSAPSLPVPHSATSFDVLA